MRMTTLRLLGVAALAACTALSCATTDAGVATKVKAKLVADDTIQAGEIDVDVNNGVVTLTGNLNDAAAKQRALELARTTEGVRSVVDMIATRTAEGRGNAPDPGRTLGDRVDDAQITMSVKSRLLDDETVGGLDIDVDTRDGVVFLTGSVRSAAERDRAVELARSTAGVRDVQANLELGEG